MCIFEFCIILNQILPILISTDWLVPVLISTYRLRILIILRIQEKFLA